MGAGVLNTAPMFSIYSNCYYRATFTHVSPICTIYTSPVVRPPTVVTPSLAWMVLSKTHLDAFV